MKIIAYLTDKYKQNRLTKHNLTLPNNIDITFDINDQKLYQTFKGFGGAFTEASGYNLSRINDKLRREALEMYFSEEGLKYSLGRVAIGGCDFSLGSYCYLKDFDDSLSSFSIERDKNYIIPMIHEASKIRNERIKIIASPWSPPFWMKDNGKYNYGGKLKKEYYQKWADYFVKFIDAYNKENIIIDAVTIQNEPAARQRWDSCIYSSEEERDFLPYLGKNFTNHNLDTKIFVWDHNRDIVLERVKPIYNSDVANYAYGTAIHWYDNEPFENIKQLHDLYPDKHIIHTEGCVEGKDKIGLYESGERYGRNILKSFNNYVEAFIDWNLFLDETGGPNWVNNLCDAPIIINVGNETIIKELSYFYIGHFSKYLDINAKRIFISQDQRVLATAFKNPNNEIVIVLQNELEDDYGIRLKIGNNNIDFQLYKRSIMTIIIGE